MSIARLGPATFAVLLSGCGGHTLDVGSNDGGLGATADLRQNGGSDPTGPWWNGVVENAQFSNGSNQLEMTLSVAADGTATGTLLLGDGSLLQPPTDPNVGYPPGVRFSWIWGGPLGFFEGFPYTILDGRLRGSTLTFGIAQLELWKQWCVLQNPVFVDREDDGGSFYSCAPNESLGGRPPGAASAGGAACTLFDPKTGQNVPIDCGKAELCLMHLPCDCSATACRGKPLTMPDVSFSLAINGAIADGTISGLLGDHAVHFVRAP